MTTSIVRGWRVTAKPPATIESAAEWVFAVDFVHRCSDRLWFLLYRGSRHQHWYWLESHRRFASLIWERLVKPGQACSQSLAFGIVKLIVVIFDAPSIGCANRWRLPPIPPEVCHPDRSKADQNVPPRIASFIALKTCIWRLLKQSQRWQPAPQNRLRCKHYQKKSWMFDTSFRKRDRWISSEQGAVFCHWTRAGLW